MLAAALFATLKSRKETLPMQIDALAEMQNAFSVLFKNWVLAVPTALVAVIAGLLAIVMFAGTMAALLASGALSGSDQMAALAALRAAIPSIGLFLVIVVLLQLLAQAIVIAGAERVWHGEPADLAHGFSRAFAKLPTLFAFFLIAFIAIVFCTVLIIIGWILGVVLAFLFMYTLPAIVVGNEGVGNAFGTSYRLVRANMNPSLITFLGIIVVSIVGGVITQIFSHVAVLGLVVQLIVGGLSSAFVALILVRMYDLLRGAGAPAVTGTTR
jgi:hypothetical protein